MSSSDKTSPEIQSKVEAHVQSFFEVVSDRGFGREISRKIKVVEVNVTNVVADQNGEPKAKRGATATVVCEVEVCEDMVNAGGALHGGCGGFLLDVCSSAPLSAVSDSERWYTTGVSSSYNLFFVNPAPEGTTLRIVSTVVQLGRTALLECKIYDKDTGKLLITGNHTKVDTSGAKSKL